MSDQAHDDGAEQKKRPASQYYWGDWHKDLALQSCPLPARGLWHEMNCLMHQGEPYGHLTMPTGRAMSPGQLANLSKISERECKKLLQQLEEAGVFSRTADGTIYSRRMVRDEATRNKRAEGGKGGAEHGIKGAEHGAKGGRPAKERGVSGAPIETPLKPPPSSSSSSSSSEEIPPVAPQGGSPVGLKAWLDGVKARSEKVLPDDDPVFRYAEDVGLPREFLHLAWVEFRHRYTQPGAKRYRDWRAVFRNAVRRDWLKLWYLDGKAYVLTTAGQQAKLALARAA